LRSGASSLRSCRCCSRFGGLRVVERFGDWSRAPLTADAALQLYVCEPD
jgi:hypothetical protein